MLDDITKHLNAIQGLKLNFNMLFDSLLIHLFFNKLDKSTLREWKELDYESDLPTIEEFLEFLKNKVDLLHSLEQSSSSFQAPFKALEGHKFKPPQGQKFKKSQSNSM